MTENGRLNLVCISVFPYFRPEGPNFLAGIFFTHWYLLAYTLAVFGRYVVVVVVVVS